DGAGPVGEGGEGDEVADRRLAVALDPGRLQVGILRRAAEAREVLDTSRDARGLEPIQKSLRAGDHRPRVASEAAPVEGVAGEAVIEVDDRREVELESERGERGADQEA